MDNNLFQKIKDLIDANQAIGIVVGANPTYDHMAAGLGLYLSLVQMKKNAAIVCPTDPSVELSSLVGIDKVQKSFGAGSATIAAAGTGDMVVAFPYREGEIEKVSYDVDNGKLKIVIKAGAQGLSFGPSDVQFEQGGQALQAANAGIMPSLVFFIGVADMQQMGIATKPQGTTIVNIDNRSQNTKYGDVVHVDSRFTSVSEEVADFLTLLEPQIELDKDTSQNLLSGILSATNNFQNGQGSYLAFEMAGILMKKGAVRTGNSPVQAAQMPASNYFPPQQQVPEPNVFQPAAQPAPVQQPNFGAVFGNAAGVQQAQPMPQPAPVQEPQFVAQPVQPVQPVQNTQNNQPPADWLTPKVYKGSTVV